MRGGHSRVSDLRRSTELACDIFLRELLARIVEDLVGVSDLDEIAGATALGDVDGKEGGPGAFPIPTVYGRPSAPALRPPPQSQPPSRHRGAEQDANTFMWRWRYLFVLVVAQWSPITFTPGVRYLVRDGEQPAKVPDRVIVGLRAREGVDGLIKLPTKLAPVWVAQG